MKNASIPSAILLSSILAINAMAESPEETAQKNAKPVQEMFEGEYYSENKTKLVIEVDWVTAGNGFEVSFIMGDKIMEFRAAMSPSTIGPYLIESESLLVCPFLNRAENPSAKEPEWTMKVRRDGSSIVISNAEGDKSVLNGRWEKSTPPAEQTTESSGKKVKIGVVRSSDGTLNVRESPDPNGALVTTLENDDAVIVVSKTADARWLLVETRNGKGYVKSKYIVPNELLKASESQKVINKLEERLGNQ